MRQSGFSEGCKSTEKRGSERAEKRREGEGCCGAGHAGHGMVSSGVFGQASHRASNVGAGAETCVVWSW